MSAPPPDKQKAQDRKFLEAYANIGDIAAAARSAKISLAVHHRRLETDPAYRKAFEAAQQQAVDLLEAEAFRRALAGSDELLMFLLRAWLPDRYAVSENTGAMTLSDFMAGRRIGREWMQ